MDDIPKAARTNPLDCAIYLTSIDKDAIDEDRLADALFEVGRYSDFLQLAKQEENTYSRFSLLAAYGQKLLDAGNKRVAISLVQNAYEVLKNDEDWSHRDAKILLSAFIRLNKDAEVREMIDNQSDDEDKAILILVAAETYLKIGRKAEAIKWLTMADAAQTAYKQIDYLFIIADLYQKLGMNSEALSELKAIALRAEQETDLEIRNYIILQTIPVYVKLREWQIADKYWNEYGDHASFIEIFRYAAALSHSAKKEDATKYLLLLENDADGLRYSGRELVQFYIDNQQIEKAEGIAKLISTENDSYEQQMAFMSVADIYIRSGNRPKAIEILDHAFERARQIVYSHRTQDSIGASPGSRKGIFLREISKRFIEMRLYDQAVTVAIAIEADHHGARESLATNLVAFAKLRARALPKTQVPSLIARATELVKDSDYYSLDIKVRSAEVYAILNERRKATDLLGEVILAGIDSCCYEDDFLIASGQIFDRYKLQTTPNMQAALLAVIEKHRQ